MVVGRVQTFISRVAQYSQRVAPMAGGSACCIEPQRRIVVRLIQLLQLRSLGTRQGAERGVTAVDQRADESSEIN